jgi:hypothetical protein
MYEIESLLALAPPPLIRLYLLYSNTHLRKDDSMANPCRGVVSASVNSHSRLVSRRLKLIHDISQKTWST